MSTLSSKYYIFIKKHSLDFNNILDNLYTMNNNLRLWCLQYDFINCYLQDLLEDYPKLLTYSNIIDHRQILYNQNKIMTATSMSVDQLNTAITDSGCYSLLNRVRKISTNYDDLVKEHTFQNNYIVKYSDVYSKNLYINNYESNDYTTNISGLLNDTYDSILNTYQASILNKQSFFHLYFLKSLSADYFSSKSTLRNNLLSNINDLDLQVDLATVVDKNMLKDDNIVSNVLDVILINQYNFNDISNDFKTLLIENTEIQESILSISNIFQDYLSERSSSFKNSYIQTSFDLYNHAFSFDFTNTVFNSKTYFNFIGLNSLSYNLYSVSDLNEFENLQIQPTDYATTLTQFEQQLISYFQTSLNDFNSLKQYFYILYLNRNQFEKFINMIDLIGSVYSFNNIRLSDVYYFNRFSHLKNLFLDWTQNIYFNNFQKLLTKTYTSAKQQQFLNINPNITKFAFVYEMYNIIEDFIKTDEFTDYLKDIQLQLYNYLRDSGYIDFNVDWCSCNIPLKVYFMSLLKTLVLDVDFFNTTDTNQYILSQMASSTYDIIDTQENFDIHTTNFIENNALPMFEFYQSFLTSLNGSVFSKAIHNVYKL